MLFFNPYSAQSRQTGHAGFPRLFAAALLLIALMNPPVRSDVPQLLLRDDAVSKIAGFELFRSGIYWWRDGSCNGGEFAHDGSIAYRPFTNLRLENKAVLSATARSGFLSSDSWSAGLSSGDFPA